MGCTQSSVKYPGVSGQYITAKHDISTEDTNSSLSQDQQLEHHSNPVLVLQHELAAEHQRALWDLLDRYDKRHWMECCKSARELGGSLLTRAVVEVWPDYSFPAGMVKFLERATTLENLELKFASTTSNFPAAAPIWSMWRLLPNLLGATPRPAITRLTVSGSGLHSEDWPWHRFMRSPGSFCPLLPAPLSHSISSHLPNLQYLCIQTCTISGAFLETLAQRCPGLKGLKLEGIWLEQASLAGLMVSVGRLRALSDLTLSRISETPGPRSPTVVEGQQGGYNANPEAPAADLAAEEGAEAAVTGGGHGPRGGAAVAGPEVAQGPAMVACLADLTRLTHLVLDYDDDDDSPGERAVQLQGLSLLTSLKSLNISCSYSLKPRALMCDMAELSCLTGLTSLSLSTPDHWIARMNLDNFEGMPHSFTWLRNLQSLADLSIKCLNNAGWFGADSIQAIEAIPGLKTLSLALGDSLDLTWSDQHQPGLTALDTLKLEGYHNNLADVHYLLRTTPNLKTLELCDDLWAVPWADTPQRLQLIARQLSESMARLADFVKEPYCLDLMFQFGAYPPGHMAQLIHALTPLQRNPNFTRLKLAWLALPGMAVDLDEGAAAALVTAMPQLTHLRLMYATFTSGRCLPILAQLRGLQVLQLVGCRGKVTASHILALHRRAPGLWIHGHSCKWSTRVGMRVAKVLKKLRHGEKMSELQWEVASSV